MSTQAQLPDLHLCIEATHRPIVSPNSDSEYGFVIRETTWELGTLIIYKGFKFTIHILLRKPHFTILTPPVNCFRHITM